MTVYQIPFQCCCGGSQLAWSIDAVLVYYDKGNACAGLGERTRAEVHGSGIGAGTATLTRTSHDGDGNIFFHQVSQIPMSPGCGTPGALVAQLVARGLGLPNAGFLGIPSRLPLDAPGAVPDSVTGSLFSDCNSYIAQEVLSAGLGSINPCAGVMATTQIRSQVMALDCVPVGTVCGACCCRGRCYSGMSPAACAGMGGTFQGPRSNCVGVICPEPVGKCCKVDGTCTLLTFPACEALPGFYMGDGTVCGARPPCPPPFPPPVRGCCFPSTGQCQDLTQAVCEAAGGNWSPLLQCFQLNCASLGACCYPDGSCASGTANFCAGTGGIFSAGETCKTVKCPACLGACCRVIQGIPTCNMETQANCALAGTHGIPAGDWFGCGVPCSPTICLAPRAGPIRIATGAETMAFGSGETAAGCVDCLEGSRSLVL